jgi:uncharacterized protein (TIGR00251 family)
VNIEVKVIAGVKKREMLLEGSRLKAKLTSKPIQGKANAELIDLIAETFAVKRREVRIIAGGKDRRKVISIPIDEEEFRKIMDNITSR